MVIINNIIGIKIWARYRIIEKRIWDTDHQKWSPVASLWGGAESRTSEVLENGIS